MPIRDHNLILFIRLGNLIFASLALSIFVMGELGCHSALSSSPPRLHHPPVTIREIVVDSMVLIWFVAAVALFFRSRLAWIGILLGIGAAVCFSVWLLIGIAGEYLFPNSEAQHLRESSIVAYILALVVGLGFFAVCFGLSLGLFIGLLKKRIELMRI